MASRILVLALAGSLALALAQDTDSMPAGHDMPVTADGNSVTAVEHTTAEHATAEYTTASQTLAATMPTAIMPSDVSDVSGTPTTLVVDTQTPPSPSSSMSWAITTAHDMGHMTHANASGVAGPTGGASPSGTGGASDSVDNVNGAVRSVYNKISVG